METEITADEARLIAEKWLSAQAWGQGWQISRVDIHGDFAMAFYCPQDGTLVAGNAPLLVDAQTRKIHVTGTAQSQRYYIENFRITGDPHIEPIERVSITGWQAGAKTTSAFSVLRENTGLQLAGSKSVIDGVLVGKKFSISPRLGVSADALCLKLREVGFLAEKMLCAPDAK